MDEAIEAVNRVAPEHLEIMTENPMEMLGKFVMRGLFLLAATVQNQLEIILPVQTMCCQQTEQHVFQVH